VGRVDCLSRLCADAHLAAKFPSLCARRHSAWRSPSLGLRTGRRAGEASVGSGALLGPEGTADPELGGHQTGRLGGGARHRDRNAEEPADEKKVPPWGLEGMQIPYGDTP
jgi:hypothetical protein